jgi:hypothetical protein
MPEAPLWEPFFVFRHRHHNISLGDAMPELIHELLVGALGSLIASLVIWVYAELRRRIQKR